MGSTRKPLMAPDDYNHSAQILRRITIRSEPFQEELAPVMGAIQQAAESGKGEVRLNYHISEVIHQYLVDLGYKVWPGESAVNDMVYTEINWIRIN